MKALILLSIASILSVVCLGCSDGPAVGHVTGKVTVDGKPADQGTIMFIPAEGKAAVGTINPDGTYTLTTFMPDDGALVGEHKVVIRSTRVGSGSMVPASLDEELAIANGKAGRKVLVPGRVDWVVPQRYSQPETTDQKVEVKAGDQVLNFNLPGG